MILSSRFLFREYLTHSVILPSTSPFRSSLLGIGNPLFEVTSPHVSPEYLDQFELKRGQAALAKPHHMEIFEDLLSGDYASDSIFAAGGATLNVCRAFTWMMTEGSGVSSYVGCVGSDSVGERLAKTIVEDDGVNIDLLVHPDASLGTARCASLILEGDTERTLIAHVGAAGEYEYSHFESQSVQAMLEDARFVYFSGFFLQSCSDVVHECAEFCEFRRKTERDEKVIPKSLGLNLSAEWVIAEHSDDLLGTEGGPGLVPELTSYLFGNETESKFLAHELLNWQPESDRQTDPADGLLSVTEIARRVASEVMTYDSTHPKVVVFTQGGTNPVVVAKQVGPAYKGDLRKFADVEVREYPILPLRPGERVLDTNGAGDSFVGGFLSQIVRGQSLPVAAEAGNWCARYIVQVNGVVYPHDDSPPF